MESKSINELGGIKVLIADDNSLQLDYMRELLVDAGAEVMAVGSSAEVEELLRREENDFACLVLEIEMPELDGYELTRRIRHSEEPKLRMMPIIGMLSRRKENEREKAIAAGMNSVILKPIIPPVLYEEILKSRSTAFLGINGKLEKLEGRCAYVVTSDHDVFCELNEAFSTKSIELDWFSSFDEFMMHLEDSKRYDFAFVDWEEKAHDGERMARKIRLFGQNTFRHLVAITQNWSDIETEALGLEVEAYIRTPIRELEVLNVMGKILLDEELGEKNLQANFKGTKILIADDNMTNAIVLQNAVETFGAEADVVFSGNEALDTLKNSPENTYNLAFIDIFMDDMQGFEVASSFRSLMRTDAVTMPIVGISGNSSIQMVEKANDSGMNALMLKPVNRHSLLSYMNIFLREENFNKAFADRMSDKLKNVQDYLRQAEYRGDIILFLVNHKNSEEVIEYIAKNLIDQIQCDKITFCSADGKFRFWEKDSKAAVPAACSNCILNSIDSSEFDKERGECIISDVESDARFADCASNGTKSILLHKIVQDGMEYGRLAIHFNDKKHVFTENERSFLSVASNIMGVAISREKDARIMEAQALENQQLLENTAMPLAMFDSNGRIMRCNASYLKVSGRSMEELQGLDAKHGVFKSGTDSNERPMRYCIVQGAHGEQVRHIVANDRKYELHARGAYNDSGELQYIFEYALDMTDAERHLERQKTINACFEAMFLKNQDGGNDFSGVMDIIVKYLNSTLGVILRFDGATVVVDGFSGNAELEGLKQQLSKATKNDWERFSKILLENKIFTVGGNSRTGVEYFDNINARNGFVKVRYARLFVQNELWGFVAFPFTNEKDFTEDDDSIFATFQYALEMIIYRNNLLERLTRERDNAIAAEKAKSFFFATVSHDIRTPLHAIVGLVDMLREGVADEKERMSYLEAINLNSKTLNKLIDDVLDLAALEAEKMTFEYEMCDLRKLVSPMLVSFIPKTKESGVNFILDMPDDFPLVEIASQRVRQVLTNLLGNAAKFTEKGSVTLSIRFTLTGEAAGDLNVAVIDTGVGIAEENISKLMNPFVQLNTNTSTGGTGLGLSICKSLIGKMNGEFKVESKLGSGSTFSFILHNVKCNSKILQLNAMRDAANAKAVEETWRKWAILLVDDTPINLKVLKLLCNRIGIKDVDTVESGAAALQKLDCKKYDVIITDLRMPYMSGEELVANIRKDSRLAKNVVYALTAEGEAVKTYQANGFDGIALKPLDFEGLKKFIRSVAPVVDKANGRG